MLEVPWQMLFCKLADGDETYMAAHRGSTECSLTSKRTMLNRLNTPARFFINKMIIIFVQGPFDQLSHIGQVQFQLKLFSLTLIPRFPKDKVWGGEG